MTRKASDPALGQAMSLLLERGWKKHAWMLYKFTTADNGFLVSATLEAVKKGNLTAALQPHLVALNQISHFVWDYGTRTHGLFKPEKLTVGKNLNDYRACSLSYLTQTRESPDPAKLVQDVDDLAQQITATESSLDDLIGKYENAPVFRGPLMCMHLLAKDFRRVRDLLNEDGVTADNGSGDVRFHIARYLDDNRLA